MHKYLHNLFLARVPAIPIRSSESKHPSRNGHQKCVRQVHNIPEQFRYIVGGPNILIS